MENLPENAKGLRLLRKPDEAKLQDGGPPVVDIVAIHGIGAKPDHSWCGRVTFDKPDGKHTRYINWLQDENMLPRDLPPAAILRYGYEANWFGESAIHMKIMDIAQKLLKSLRRHRNNNPGRPMVFVCHCYGGLVVLQALLEARNHPGDWPEIFDSTSGLVFFSTPFRGAPGMDQVEMLEAARRNYEEDEIQGETLRILQSGNEMLLNLVNEFCRVRGERNVMCFYERKSTEVNKLFGQKGMTKYVVDQSSGCLDLSNTTQSSALSRDHFNMNKFEDPFDEDFVEVKETIHDMVIKAPGLVQRLSSGVNTTSLTVPGFQELSLSHHGSRQGSRQGSARGSFGSQVEVPRKETIFWNLSRTSTGGFVGRDDTLDDIQSKILDSSVEAQKRYVITGIGGLGKSEICLKVIDRIGKHFDIVAWIDVSTRVGAEKSLMDFAENQKQHVGDLTGARNTLASIPGTHLIVLDNADDPREDYKGYAPPSSKWSVIITSRNVECGRHQTVGHWDLQSLAIDESLKLLYESAKVPSKDRPSLEPHANKIVECLGSHTLGLVQAGSYLSRGRCTFEEYPKKFKTEAHRLLQHEITQEGSRYTNAWATFEVTASALDMNQQSHADAQRLLDTLAMLHFTNFPVEIFFHTWKEARQIIKSGVEATGEADRPRAIREGLLTLARTRSIGAGKDYLQHVYARGVFRLLAHQVSDFLPILSNEWEWDRIHDALDVLTELALIQRSATTEKTLTISMHKLTHSWAQARMIDPQTKRQAWLRAGSTIVLSNMTTWLWADPEVQLRPHARYFADNSRSFDISGVPQDMAEKIVLFAAELLQMLREDEVLQEFLDTIIKELEKRGKTIKELSLPLCKVKAKNLLDLCRIDDAVDWWTDIVETEKKSFTATRQDRLESQHQLGISMFSQGRRKEATEVLKTVTQECQQRLPEDNAVRLSAEHDYADFCGMGGDFSASLKLFAHVVEVRKRKCKHTQSELLISQHQMARTILASGDPEEAMRRFQHVLKIREENLPETHPERLATQHEVGCCYREMREYDKAIASLEKVVRIRKQTLAADNMEGLLSQTELATTYMAAGRLDDAVTALEHVVANQKHLRPDNPNRFVPEQMLDDCYAERRSICYTPSTSDDEDMAEEV